MSKERFPQTDIEQRGTGTIIMAIKIHYFASISGAGWLLDFLLFNCLLQAGLPGGIANMISASAAVTFVYILSRKWIFRKRVGSLAVTVAKYVAWNAVAISLASLAVQAISALVGYWPMQLVHAAMGMTLDDYVTPASLSALMAKLLVTPFTMYANFVAMSYIVERRLAFV